MSSSGLAIWPSVLRAMLAVSLWVVMAALPRQLLAQSPSERSAAALGPVDKAYFGLGVTGNDGATPWPSIPFGSLRLWDAHVTWPHLEPQRGQWNFATLDRYVSKANQQGVNLLLVLGHSPSWASARSDEPNAYRPGYAAEPASLADWEAYVRTVAMRYKGRIKEYQVWNEASDRNHYTGTVEKLVELTCTAWRVLKQVDSSIKVVSAGSAGGGRHVQYLDDFLGAGGAACIDVVAHHFYVARLGPEAMVPIIRQVKAVMHKRGVGRLPLWCTEVGWWIAGTDGEPDSPIVAKGGWRKLDAADEAGGVIQRALLLSRAEGVARLYWYAWNNAYGWSLTNKAREPKPAALHWILAYQAMIDAQRIECDLHSPIGTCTVVTAKGEERKLRWSDATALVPREGPRPTDIDTSASVPTTR